MTPQMEKGNSDIWFSSEEEGEEEKENAEEEVFEGGWLECVHTLSVHAQRRMTYWIPVRSLRYFLLA